MALTSTSTSQRRAGEQTLTVGCRATDPDRHTSVPRPAITAGGGGQVQRTWSKHKSRASGWLAGALAGWLAGEPNQPSGDSLLVFCDLYSTHTLRAGILDLTSYDLATILRCIHLLRSHVNLYSRLWAARSLARHLVIRLTNVTYNLHSSYLSYIL